MEVVVQIQLPRNARNLMDRLLCDVDDRLGSNGVQELKVQYTHYAFTSLNLQSDGQLLWFTAEMLDLGLLIKQSHEGLWLPGAAIQERQAGSPFVLLESMHMHSMRLPAHTVSNELYMLIHK